jgi:hypothetical protein
MNSKPLNGDIMEGWGLLHRQVLQPAAGSRIQPSGQLTLKTQHNLSSAIKLSAFSILTDRGVLWLEEPWYQESARFFLEGPEKQRRRHHRRQTDPRADPASFWIQASMTPI